MSEIFKIAIDGPSGAGKSTVAKIVAKKLNIEYVDTGAMYRAFGLKMLKNNIKMEENDGLFNLLNTTDIDFCNGKVMLDGVDVSGEIRTNEVSKAASDCSAFKSVRKKLVEIQQGLGNKKSIIMDGRDICSVVLFDAEYKYYLTATAEERAKRRCAEMLEKGDNVSYEETLKKINERDYNDMNRKVDPLRPTKDAIIIDSTDMTIDEVVNFIISKVK